MASKDKIKVVILGKYSYDEHVLDGAVRYSDGLANALANIDSIDLHIVTLGPCKKTIELKKKTLHIIPYSKIRPKTGLPELLPLVRQIAELKPSIVHCIGMTQPYGLPALYLKKSIILK